MALLFTLLCGGAVVVLAYFSYYFYRGHYVHSAESIIDTELRYLKTHPSLDEALQGTSRIYLLLDADGSSLGGNIEALPATADPLVEGLIVFETEGRYYAAKIHTFPDNRQLLVGTDITAISKQFRFMKWLSLISILMMLMVIFTSYLISRFVVTHTNRIAMKARSIMETGDLSQRIDVRSGWDDLSYMASVLNQFLERVQELMIGIRQVSDNIAHDLRTPLTRLRNQLESLKQQKPEDSAAIDDLLQETDQLLKTFNALLKISRIEMGKQHSAFIPVDLCQLIKDVIDLYEPLAEVKSIQISNDLEDIQYTGDRDLLFQALANILDNSIKYTPPEGKVDIQLKNATKHISIIVHDTGPGVDETEREKIFTRFYRGEKSRHTSGNGLGLSLTAAAINIHRGEIMAHNTNSGLSIEIRLPS